MLKEAQLKAALIDKLFEIGMLKNAVLINEMVVAKSIMRADLVVANGHLQAFEIKSEFDSLYRLSGQLKTYIQCFDKLTLIVSTKFITSVLEMAPKYVEIWEAILTKDGCIKFNIIRKGSLNKVNDKSILCDFLLKKELSVLSKMYTKKASKNLSRDELIKEIANISVLKLRTYILHFLKERYKVTFEDFMKNRKEKTCISDLKNLSKNKLKKRILNERLANLKYFSPQSPKKYLEFSRLFPDGNIPCSIPRYVLLPKR